MDREILDSEKDSHSSPSESFPKNLNPCRRILFSISVGVSIIVFGLLLGALGYQNYRLWRNQENLDDLSSSDQKMHYWQVGRGTAKIFKPYTNSKGSQAQEPPHFKFNEDAVLNPRCFNVDPYYQTGSKVETLNGSCIRTYSEKNCVGLSTAHYPKYSTTPRSVAEDAGDLKSVGPCVTNELDDHTLKYGQHSSSVEYQKRTILGLKTIDPEIPDQFEVLSGMAMPLDLGLELKSTSTSTAPLINSTQNSSSTSNVQIIEFLVRSSDLDQRGNLPEKILIPKVVSSAITNSWNLRLLFNISKGISRFLAGNSDGTLVLVKIQMDTTGFVYRIQFGQSHIQTFYVATGQ